MSLGVQHRGTAEPFANFAVFARAVKDWGLDPTAAAVILIQLPKRVARRSGNTTYTFSRDQMSEVLRAFRDGTLAREGVVPTLTAVTRGTPFTHDTAPPPCTPKELEAIIHESSVSLQQNLRNPDRRVAVLMGMIMGRVRGRTPGRTVASIIEREWKEVQP